MTARIHARKLLLAAAAAVLLAFLCAAFLAGTGGATAVSDLRALTAEEWQSLTETGVQVPERQLLLNGQAAPRAGQVYYIPQDLESADWAGSLSVGEGWTLVCPPQAAALMGDRAGLLQSGETVVLAAVQGTEWFPVQVIFTGLPMMVWNTQGQDVDEEGRAVNVGQVLYFDGRRQTVQTSGMTWRIRGGASRSFDKPGYKLNLRGSGGQNRSLQFGQMRSDDDWILRSLFTDPQKVREMVAVQVWNEIAENSEHDSPTAAMEYVELIIDGEYMGLYGLSERVDDKQAQLGSADVMYKYASYAIPSAAELAEAEIARAQEALGRGVRIYGAGVKAPSLWGPLEQLLDRVYAFGMEGRGFDGVLDSEHATDASAMTMPYQAAEDYETLAGILDVENVLDWGFFNQALQLADSDLNNMYLVARCQEDGSYRFQYIPWDMDYSFGTFNDDDANHSRTIPEFYRKLRSTYALDALLRSDPEGISALGRTRWEQLRAGPLDIGRLWQKMDQANALTVNSGAFARDAARWPQEESDEDLNYMKEYIRDRLEFLDSYYLTQAWTDFD